MISVPTPLAAPRSPSIDDSGLLPRLRAGDEAAFEDLVRRHIGPMLAVARRLLRSEDAARDAVQEAFLSAYRSIPSFREDASLSTWLHRIVVNASLMRLRRDKRRAETQIDELLPHFTESGRHAEAPDPWRLSAESLMLTAERRAMVRRAVDQLPVNHRTVLMLRDIEEMSTAQVAAALDISENAVKIRLHRARQALATLLGRLSENPRP